MRQARSTGTNDQLQRRHLIGITSATARTGELTLKDLAETFEIADWKMPKFKAACAYAATQGWLIDEDDVLTLTTAGLGAA